MYLLLGVCCDAERKMCKFFALFFCMTIKCVHIRQRFSTGVPPSISYITWAEFWIDKYERCFSYLCNLYVKYEYFFQIGCASIFFSCRSIRQLKTVKNHWAKEWFSLNLNNWLSSPTLISCKKYTWSMFVTFSVKSLIL